METETDFQRIRRIMSLQPDFEPLPATPWTDDEFEAFARQEPLNPTDFPNAGMQLPANEEQLTEVML